MTIRGETQNVTRSSALLEYSMERSENYDDNQAKSHNNFFSFLYMNLNKNALAAESKFLYFCKQL